MHACLACLEYLDWLSAFLQPSCSIHNRLLKSAPSVGITFAEWGAAGSFRQLRNLTLSGCRLNGVLPDWGADETAMQNLQYLWLNSMDGDGLQGSLALTKLCMLILTISLRAASHACGKRPMHKRHLSVEMQACIHLLPLCPGRHIAIQLVHSAACLT